MQRHNGTFYGCLWPTLSTNLDVLLIILYSVERETKMPEESHIISGKNPREIATEMAKKICTKPVFLSELNDLMSVRRKNKDFKSDSENDWYLKGIRDGVILLLSTLAKTGSILGGEKIPS